MNVQKKINELKNQKLSLSIKISCIKSDKIILCNNGEREKSANLNASISEIEAHQLSIQKSIIWLESIF
jgi:hypothetical protein